MELETPTLKTSTKISKKASTSIIQVTLIYLEEEFTLPKNQSIPIAIDTPK